MARLTTICTSVPIYLAKHFHTFAKLTSSMFATQLSESFAQFSGEWFFLGIWSFEIKACRVLNHHSQNNFCICVAKCDNFFKHFRKAVQHSMYLIFSKAELVEVINITFSRHFWTGPNSKEDFDKKIKLTEPLDYKERLKWNKCKMNSSSGLLDESRINRKIDWILSITITLMNMWDQRGKWSNGEDFEKLNQWKKVTPKKLSDLEALS